MISSALWFALALLAAPATSAAPPPGAATQPAPAQPAASAKAGGPAAQPAAAATPADGAEAVEDRLARAEKLYKKKNYVESARELEGLWADTGHPNALFNAALARFAAGHYAHALSYLEAYVDDVKDAPPEAVELAKFQISAAKDRSAEVPVMVGPPAAVAHGAEVTIRRVPDGPKDTRPDLRFRIPPSSGEAPGARTIHLDPGRWTAEVRATGYVAEPQEITIVKGKEKEAAGVNFVMGLDPKLRQVSFRVDVPADATIDAVAVEVRSTSGAGETKTCTIKPFEVNECTVLTELGTWEVSASAAGFTPFRQVITLASGQGPIAYTLPLASSAPPPTPEPAPEPAKSDVVPKPVRMRMAGGLNAGGLPLFVTGLGLAVYGSNTYDRAISADPADCASTVDNYTCRTDTIKAVRLRTAGLALVGTATGLFVTGLTAEFDVKPRVWYAEMGAGGALLVGGAAWLAATNGGLNKELRVEGGAPPWDESVPRIDRATNQRLAAAMFMGTGIGLVTGSTIGLLVRKRFERRRGPSKPSARLSPFTPLGGGGLMVQGRF